MENPNLSEYGREVVLSFRQLDALCVCCEKPSMDKGEWEHFKSAMVRISLARHNKPLPDLDGCTNAVPLTDDQMLALEQAARREYEHCSRADFTEAIRRISGSWCEAYPGPEDATEEEHQMWTVKLVARDPRSPFKGLVSFEDESEAAC